MMHLVSIKILLNNHNILRYIKVSIVKKMDVVIKEDCPAADNLEENGCASDSVCTFMSTHTTSDLS